MICEVYWAVVSKASDTYIKFSEQKNCTWLNDAELIFCFCMWYGGLLAAFVTKKRDLPLVISVSAKHHHLPYRASTQEIDFRVPFQSTVFFLFGLTGTWAFWRGY